MEINKGDKVKFKINNKGAIMDGFEGEGLVKEVNRFDYTVIIKSWIFIIRPDEIVKDEK